MGQGTPSHRTSARTSDRGHHSSRDDREISLSFKMQANDCGPENPTTQSHQPAHEEKHSNKHAAHALQPMTRPGFNSGQNSTRPGPASSYRRAVDFLPLFHPPQSVSAKSGFCMRLTHNSCPSKFRLRSKWSSHLPMASYITRASTLCCSHLDCGR